MMPSYFRTPHRLTTDIDISSVAFWTRTFDEREKAFAQLRSVAPVSWHRPYQTPGLPKRNREAGFWAITRAADIAYVSRRHDLFSSEIGQVNVRPTPFRIDDNMLVLDPPIHTVYRRIVSPAFMPRAVAALDPVIDRYARQIVFRAGIQQTFDFVDAISARMPLLTIAHLIGIPQSERDRFTVAADSYVRTRLPARQEDIEEQGRYLRSLCESLAEFKRRHPADDLMTRLIQARVADQPLSHEVIHSTILLIIMAGNDTTKQAITLSYLALARFPEQRVWLANDIPGRFATAFEELLRYTSPIISFARTVTTDTELGGYQLNAGDKVALFYCSGNRDESLFSDPNRLDLGRTHNQHVAFGGGGVRSLSAIPWPALR